MCVNLSYNIILKKGLQVLRETHLQRRHPSVLVEVSDNKFTLSKPITFRVTDSNQPILVNQQEQTDTFCIDWAQRSIVPGSVVRHKRMAIIAQLGYVAFHSFKASA